MAKLKSLYVCQNCAFESPKWMGQCPDCGEWNTFEETLVQNTAGKSAKSASGGSVARTQRLSDVKPKKVQRVSSGINEFNRVLGGGFVNGQVILLSGEPGIGKSTILTQISKSMTNENNEKSTVIYVAGEESPEQIKLRADRMNYEPQNLLTISETNADLIARTVEHTAGEEEVGLIIVDSIQTLVSDELTGIAGSVGQVKLGAQILAQTAKKLGIPMILIGHVTKEGSIAGPKVLEHLVDTVLYLEGDAQHMFRILKTTKNRFGPVSEVGIFEMTEEGLNEVTNPSELFLKDSNSNVPGSCTTVVMEGYRPLLFEIQALTTKTAFGYPVRTTSGFNVNRLKVLIAVLEKRAGLNLSNHDVYVNVAGGFKIDEYAADMAVCLAIASSLKDKPLPKGTVAFGETGLLGEIRRVPSEEKRVKEANKLGYNNVINPSNTKTIRDAINKSFINKQR